MNARTLLRALFKRPSAAGAAPIETRYELARIDLDGVERYRRALGFAGEGVPLTWCYLPVQRAHLATMLGGRFPFRVVGIVHVDNALRGEAEPAPGLPLVLDTTVTLGEPAASGAVHAVLETRASQLGAPVFSCRSTYLVVRPRPGPRPGGPRPPAATLLLPALAEWRLGPASGRAYAAVSGDWNPIHLWPWSARLLGMRAPIIHGMHGMGRACAELERASGLRVAALDGRFKAPVPLGSRVVLGAYLEGRRYELRLGERTALEGRFDLI